MPEKVLTRALGLLLALTLFTVLTDTASAQEAALEEPAADSSPVTLPTTQPAPPTGEAAELWVNANTAYEGGDHATAVELYEQLLAQGMASGQLYYNLGNAYLRAGELGRAIASYRRSQVFQPRDQDVEANLRFARQSTKDALSPPTPHPVASTLFFWHYQMSRAELGTLLVLVNTLFWGILLGRFYRPSSEILRWGAWALLIFVVGTAASVGLHHLRPSEVAVVLPAEIEVRSGTSESDLVLFKLHAGAEVRLVDRREGALRIALPEDGQGGWIRAEDADVVRM